MKTRLRLLGGALIGLAFVASLGAYLFLPAAMQESCYILSGLFAFMAAFCLL